MSNGLSKSVNMACFVSFSERLAGQSGLRQIMRDGTALLQLADYPPARPRTTVLGCIT